MYVECTPPKGGAHTTDTQSQYGHHSHAVSCYMKRPLRVTVLFPNSLHLEDAPPLAMLGDVAVVRPRPLDEAGPAGSKPAEVTAGTELPLLAKNTTDQALKCSFDNNE